MTFHDDMTLKNARAQLRQLVEPKGHPCPCCRQLAKVYRRRINAGMARTAITMYRHGAADAFVHTPSLPGDTHEASQLAWWGLVEEERALRPDGGRAGWWRLSTRGVAYVRGEVALPRYARVYDHRLLGHAGEPLTIRDALGARFDYTALMAGVA